MSVSNWDEFIKKMEGGGQDTEEKENNKEESFNVDNEIENKSYSKQDKSHEPIVNEVKEKSLFQEEILPKQQKPTVKLKINKLVTPIAEPIKEDNEEDIEGSVFQELFNNVNKVSEIVYNEPALNISNSNPSSVTEWIEETKRENEEKERLRKEQEKERIREQNKNSMSVSEWLNKVKEEQQEEQPKEAQDSIEQDRFHGMDKVFKENPELLEQVVLEDTRSTIAPIESIEVEEEAPPDMMELLRMSETSYPDEWIETYEKAQRSKKVNSVADKLRSGRFRINKEHQVEILADYKTNGKSSDNILSERWF